jgi:hypothetical protein
MQRAELAALCNWHIQRLFESDCLFRLERQKIALWASDLELFRPPLHYGEAIFITHVVSEFCSILINPSNVCKSSQCLSFDIQDMSMYLARPGANS